LDTQKQAHGVDPSLLLLIRTYPGRVLLARALDMAGTIEELLVALESVMPGILEQFTRRYLLTCEEYIAPSIELSDSVRALFASPVRFFGSETEGQLFDAVTRHFWEPSQRVPSPLLRSVLAHIYVGIGNYQCAITNIYFAHCEQGLDNFQDHIENTTVEAARIMHEMDGKALTMLIEEIMTMRSQ